MNPVRRRFLLALVVLGLLMVGSAGLWLAASRAEAVARPPTEPADEPRLLTPAQAETYAFFNQGRPTPAGSGRGLFETDFFKPPPPTPPKPKPPAPTTRDIAVVYRGLAEFPGGASIAYIAVEDRLFTLERGASVGHGWTLSAFDSEKAVLAKEGETVTLDFNRRATLAVPAK